MVNKSEFNPTEVIMRLGNGVLMCRYQYYIVHCAATPSPTFPTSTPIVPYPVSQWPLWPEAIRLEPLDADCAPSWCACTPLDSHDSTLSVRVAINSTGLGYQFSREHFEPESELQLPPIGTWPRGRRMTSSLFDSRSCDRYRS